MASKDNSEDLRNTQQASTKSPGPSEGQRDDSSNMLTAHPPTKLENILVNFANQVSTCTTPPPNPSDNQNASPTSAPPASHLIQEVPLHSGAADLQEPPQARTVATGSNGRGSTSLDWIVPVATCHGNQGVTISERLQPTLSKAHAERNSFSIKAKMAGWTLNVAIFLQVLLGSLTTGVSAGATSGKQAAIGTTILGALSTLVASYLARARGSGEPELSVTRVKDLEQFIREVDAFLMDHGDDTTHDHDNQLHKFRMRFEELLGNMTHKSARGPPNAANTGASNV